MATGVPKRASKTLDADFRSSDPQGLVLSYPGKVPVEEILATSPGQLQHIYSTPGGGGAENRLYYADNLEVVPALLQDEALRGKVRLIYIDPPFATQSVFHSRKLAHAYDDTLTGAAFIESLRQRIVLLRELLADDGSMYVHIDEKMVFHLKLIMDEVFGSANYRNCIVRKKCNPKNYTRRSFGKICDYILFYTKTDQYIWNRQFELWTDARAKEYQYVEPGSGRRFMKVPVHAPGVRRGETGTMWRGKLPPKGKHWQFPPRALDEMDARGEIYWSSNGNPRRKVYLDESPGVGAQDVWLEFKDAHNQNVEITGYPTEKNPELLKRIVQASSNEGDYVVDCFSGSGTTLAVADSLRRRWVGCDSSGEAIRTTLDRFHYGLEKMGDFVTPDRGANGNGDHKHTPSLFEALEDIPTPTTPARTGLVANFVVVASDDRSEPARDVVEDWIRRTGRQLPVLLDSQPPKPKLKAAERLLKSQDPTLAQIIKRLGPCQLSSSVDGFQALCEAVVGQQLSKAAAHTVRTRLRAMFPGGRMAPEDVLRLGGEQLRSAGLSGRKAACLQELASLIVAKSIDLDAIRNLSDEDAIQVLTRIKGVGRWTAEMYLVFCLNRLDIFPKDDLALKTAMSKLYRKKPANYAAWAERLSERWRPYRSVACWYLYRYLDGALTTPRIPAVQPNRVLAKETS